MQWNNYKALCRSAVNAVYTVTSECSSCSVTSDSLQPHGLYPARLLCPWGSPGKNPGEGCYALLQGIFLAQGWNLSRLHSKQILYMSHQGSPT